MSEKKTEADITTLDNSMPTPPAENPAVTKPVVKNAAVKNEADKKPLDNSMPGEPAKTEADADAITTLDNSMPAPPALGLDRGK
jgi:hypothetical protein